MILDDINSIKKLDSKNMLGSIAALGKQVEEVWGIGEKLKLPADYKKITRVVVLGMGGSALGAHVIKSVFKNELEAPVEIVNEYHVPNYVDADTLVLVSSYSGGTEEPLFAVKEAIKRRAKVVGITSGGELGAWCEAQKIPVLIFTTNNNPCGSPRMGLGYSIFGQLIIFSKIGLIKFDEKMVKTALETIAKYNLEFGPTTTTELNLAKKLALAAKDHSVWYVGSEHLSGSAHVAANQMNENAKRFAGYFIVPELNHHLMEGMNYPDNNKRDLLFVLLESKLYDARVQKRYSVTKDILDKNKITHFDYACQESNVISQFIEVLILGSYGSYYSAILQGIDPTAIPFVDYFKEQLKKGRE